MSDIYEIGLIISRVLIFIGCWIYCIVTYGFLLGVGLGWLASGITAYLLSFLWPVIAVLPLVIWLLAETAFFQIAGEIVVGLGIVALVFFTPGVIMLLFQLLFKKINSSSTDI